MIQSKVYVNIENGNMETQIPILEITKRREATELETEIYNIACKFILHWWSDDIQEWFDTIASQLIDEEWIAHWEREANDPTTYTCLHDTSIDIIVNQKIWSKEYPVIAYTIWTDSFKECWNLNEAIVYIQEEVEEARRDIKYLYKQWIT